ncbi:hypothetical protein AALP_AA2G053000 [Arabis alpina]|uniref:Uncharacterized protein n=1 Tax=Arabis alpina TaxID=50452 RepID=A0A087HFH1_ARAAL|nr:hypothetical protein AALP_AA2G053000 [Arabis alpina]
MFAGFLEGIIGNRKIRWWKLVWSRRRILVAGVSPAVASFSSNLILTR